VSQPADRLVRHVSIAASAGLALMLVATIGYIAWPRVAAAIGFKPTAAPAPYAEGDQVDVPAAWYSTADTTLIVFARASCAACEKAQPFLATLVAHADASGAAVMAHPPGMDEEDRQFARSLGVADDKVMVVGAGLKVRATPTILIVNRAGRILGAWDGAGEDDRQASILKAVEAAFH
jgi:thioredoxin-related protein